MKLYLVASLLLTSLSSFAETYTISENTRFCSITSSGLEFKAVRDIGYVINGGQFELTMTQGDRISLNETEIANLELYRKDKSDKIVAASETTFLSHGQTDGLFKFTEAKLASGHKVGMIKNKYDYVIIMGSTKFCK
ncbi:hypothetical protein CIK05_06290 [Bdellovibrio sp. qaytius]|nr:hypothetical protein CIK05_06290 [Bdellovibrio sp. qaytius]